VRDIRKRLREEVGQLEGMMVLGADVSIKGVGTATTWARDRASGVHAECRFALDEVGLV
jgi:hypothetical protein